MRTILWLIAALFAAGLVPFVGLFLIWAASAHAEPICQNVTAPVPVLPNGVIQNLDTIPLTPGRWDCTATAATKTNGVVNQLQVSLEPKINTFRLSLPNTATSGPSGGPGADLSVSTTPIRLEPTSNTNYFLNVKVWYPTGQVIKIQSYYHCVNATLSN